MDAWSEVPIELFKTCSEELHHDEFLYTKDFDVEKTLNMLDISSKKLDSHLISKGYHTIEELIESDGPIPNENATEDEILGICGKFVDLQASRFEGNDVLFNVLSSVYIHKAYKIVHPILAFMFKCFSRATVTMEAFAMSAHPYSVPFWQISTDIDEIVQFYTDEELQEEFSKIELPEVLRKLASFELSLANLFENPLRTDLDFDFDVPEQTSDVGFSSFLHFRDYSPVSTPVRPQIPEHKQVRSIIQSLIDDIKSIERPETIPSITEFLKKTFEWNISAPHTSLARLIRAANYTDPKNRDVIFGKFKVEDSLRHELDAFKIPHQIYQSKYYADLLDQYSIFISRSLSVFCFHLPHLHSYCIKHLIINWANVQSIGYMAFDSVRSHLPRAQHQSFQTPLSMLFPLFSVSIATQLLRLIIKAGLLCEIYSPKEMSYLWSLLDTITTVEVGTRLNTRLADSVFKAKSKHAAYRSRSKAIVSAKDCMLYLPPETIEEASLKLEVEYMKGLMYSQAAFLKSNALDLKYGEYYNPAATYKNVLEMSNYVSHFSVKTWEEYSALFEGDSDSLYDKAKTHLSNVSNAAKSIKTTFMYIPEGSSKLVLEAMKLVVIITKAKGGAKVEVEYKPGSLYPEYKVIC